MGDINWDKELWEAAGKVNYPKPKVNPFQLAAAAIDEFSETCINFRKANPDLFDADGFLEEGGDADK